MFTFLFTRIYSTNCLLATSDNLAEKSHRTNRIASLYFTNSRARELYDSYEYDGGGGMMLEDSTAAADYNDYDYDTKRDDGYGGGSGYGGGYDDGIRVCNQL